MAVVAAIDETFAISVAVPEALFYDLLSSWLELNRASVCASPCLCVLCFRNRPYCLAVLFLCLGVDYAQAPVAPNLRVNSSCVDLAPSYVSP